MPNAGFFAISLPLEFLKRIEKFAEEEGRSKSSMIQRLAQAEMDRREQESKKERVTA